MSSWQVNGTDQFDKWFNTLDKEERSAIYAAVEFLEEHGPGLGRPFVDTLRGSRHANMKELRPPAGNIRILFAFDPHREAILLIGGDKTHQWNTWYKKYIPLADNLYDEHLAELKKEEQSP